MSPQFPVLTLKHVSTAMVILNHSEILVDDFLSLNFC